MRQLFVVLVLFPFFDTLFFVAWAQHEGLILNVNFAVCGTTVINEGDSMLVFAVMHGRSVSLLQCSHVNAKDGVMMFI
jgi:hypothetical protein